MKNKFNLKISNESNYDADIVWENAQDLEHINFLHKNTNFDYQTLYAKPSKNKDFAYDLLFFKSIRKLAKFLPITSFGFRKIIKKYEIWQTEWSPLIKTRVSLKSTIEPVGKKYKKTQLIDYIQVEAPYITKLIKNRMISELENHARIQCLEDEDFRMRRQNLKNRGINQPLRFFNEPEWEKIFENFEKLKW